MASTSKHKSLKRADPSTIHDKFLVGYQGWFTCAGDGEPVGPGHHGWLHWFNHPIPDGGRPNIDIWPDLAEYTPSELFPAPGVKYAHGEQAFLFSSRHPKTVQRHFRWMAMHGVDGAFLQRFAGQCDMESGNEGIRRIRDEVGDRVMEAAQKEGRVFAIMYDVSGVAPDRIQRVIEHDWIHLIRRKAILDSPSYLREHGRPVVALWGFGMSDAHHSPATIRAIARFIRDNTPGGAYIMAGVPAHWRTSAMDADPDPEFVSVWMEEFDAISPWTVGRYSDEEGADRHEQEKTKGDVEFIKEHNQRSVSDWTATRKIDYIPVVFPGGSGFNLSEGKWSWNDCPRKGGHFLWRQVYNVRRHNVRTIYGAMWDEYDEGTAFMPVVSHKRELPALKKHRFMALDEDGFDLPPDWFMRICGFAAEGLRGERLILGTFPSKELQDYWSSRPHYEDDAGPSSQASGSDDKEKGPTWQEWEKLAQSKGNGDELPPPPYSLEAEEPQGGATSDVPPPVPLERRPTLQAQGPPTAPLSTRPAPPPVTAGSRPQAHSNPSESHHATSHPITPQLSSQVIPIEDFSRLSVSSTSCSPQPEHIHSSRHSHSPSPRPVSPAHSHTSHSSPFPTPAPLPNAEPGFSPNIFPTPSPSLPPGPWSQAAWPPLEWNHSYPQGPAAMIDQIFHYGGDVHHGQGLASHQHQHKPGYSPSYSPAHLPVPTASPPPPLRPRPSLSHHTRPTSSPPQSPDHGYSTGSVGGFGFGFPEAHVPAPAAPDPDTNDNYNYYGASSSSSPYASSPYTHTAPGTHFPTSSYASASFPLPESAAPHGHAYNYGSGPIQSDQHTPSRPGEQPGSPYAPPPAPYAHSHSDAYSPPPPPTHAARPPHPPAGYSGNHGFSSSGSGSSGSMSGSLGQALNVVGNVAGQGAKNHLQNLANSGTKLFKKYAK